MDWFYAEMQEQKGPYPDPQFRALIEEGTVRPDTLVWRDGMTEWLPLADVADAPRPEEPVAEGITTPAVVAPLSPTPEIADGGSAPEQEMGYCSECNQRLALSNMVQYGDATICGNCKDTFFQKIREGATPNFGGNTPNADLMARARASLSGRWGIAIGLVLIYGLINGAAGQIPFLSLLLAGPFMVGFSTFFLTITRGDEPELGMLFKGFKQFGPALGAYLLMTLFVMLWSLLLIVPGIIAAYSYSQIFYILAEDPNIGPMEALRLSKQMMKGKKWKFFCLQCRFIGWSLLCVLTLFIGFLWLWPYIYASGAEFYDDLRYGSKT